MSIRWGSFGNFFHCSIYPNYEKQMVYLKFEIPSSKLTLTKFATWFLLTSSLESSLEEGLSSGYIWYFHGLGLDALAIKTAPLKPNCDTWPPEILLLIQFLSQTCFLFFAWIDQKPPVFYRLRSPMPPGQTQREFVETSCQHSFWNIWHWTFRIAHVTSKQGFRKTDSLHI